VGLSNIVFELKIVYIHDEFGEIVHIHEKLPNKT
jgi:hypothetical protein